MNSTVSTVITKKNYLLVNGEEYVTFSQEHEYFDTMEVLVLSKCNDIRYNMSTDTRKLCAKVNEQR
jgi:hypothetical protein